MTSLKELQALGGFVPEKPVKKEIGFKLPNSAGEMVEHKFDIHVKQLSIGEHEAMLISDGQDRSKTAKIISTSITLGKDGSESISFKDAYRMHPSLATAMLNAFFEVNTPKKSLPVGTDS